MTLWCLHRPKQLGSPHIRKVFTSASLSLSLGGTVLPLHLYSASSVQRIFANAWAKRHQCIDQKAQSSSEMHFHY